MPDQPPVLLLHQEIEHAFFIVGRDDDFGKDAVDGFGGSVVERAVDHHDAAEGRLPVRSEGPMIGSFERLGDGHAARVGMFEDPLDWRHGRSVPPSRLAR